MQIRKKAAKDTVQSSALPSGEAVRLIFHGMAGFICQGNDCVVGFMNSASDLQHPLEIYAYDANCVELKKWTNHNLVGKPISLEVVKPDLAVVKAARFYQPNGARINRTDIKDPEDFQWLIDLESPEMYGRSLNPDFSLYDPQVKISPAIFYTFRVTNSTFLAITDDGSNAPGKPVSFSYLGNVAEYMAANIYLQAGGQVILKVDGFPVSIPQGEIHFFNQCMDENTSSACQFDANAPDKEDRNDFYQHYEAIDLGDDPELQLVIVQKKMGSPVPKICGGGKHPHFNDEAPCAGAGYGGGGFPAYP